MQPETAAPIPKGRQLTLREQRELTARRVLEEVERSGAVPSTLREHMIDHEQKYRWLEGKPMTREDVARYVDQWSGDLLAKYDKQKD